MATSVGVNHIKNLKDNRKKRRNNVRKVRLVRLHGGWNLSDGGIGIQPTPASGSAR
jgi:hypothetical protein